VNGYARVEICLNYEDDEKNQRACLLEDESATTSSRLFNGTPKSAIDFESSSNLFKLVIDYFKQLPEHTVLIEIDGGFHFNSEPAQLMTEISLANRLISRPIIKKLIELYLCFSELHSEFKKYSDERYHPAFLTFNIGKIRTTSESILLEGIIRIPPHLAEAQVQHWKKAAQAICHAVSGTLQILDYKPAQILDAYHPFAMSIKKALNNQALPTDEFMNYTSHEAILLGRMKIPTVVLGPGKPQRVLFSPFENVELNELNQAIELYCNIIASEAI